MSFRGSNSGPVFPERIGRYEILLPIASGGMATVYLGRSRGIGGFERDVAVKLTHAYLKATPEFATELIEEAKLAARIRHVNVVQVVDVGDDPCGLFLVMDYVEGDTLDGLLRRSAKAGAPLSPAIGLRILFDALAGLHAAHELEDDEGQSLHLVHRDFSPQNILVGLDGVSRLTDFGVAKATSRLSQTRTGGIKGKIAYMAPEQARAKPLDRRCDVWAAGVIAWEVLTGRRLFDGAAHDEMSLLLQIATQVPPRLRSVDPRVPMALDDAVASALTSDLQARCPSAAAFERALLEGCKAARIDLATSSEVGRVVEALNGTRLAERREKAKEVYKLRAQVSTLALGSSDGLVTPASFVGVSHFVPPELDGAPMTLALPAAPATLALPAPPRFSPAPVPTDTTTSTASVSTDGGRGGMSRAPARWASAAIGAGTLIALSASGWLVVRHRGDDAAAANALEPSASSTVVTDFGSAPGPASTSPALPPAPPPGVPASSSAAAATTASSKVGEAKRAIPAAAPAPPTPKKSAGPKKEDRIGF